MARPQHPRPASPLQEFLASEAAGGVALMAAAALAMLVANLPGPIADGYHAALHLTTGPVINAQAGAMTVHLWINDGLMALFFLLVGLEIKREFIGGELASWERRRLPIIAAAAGMIAPALVYLAIAGGNPALQRGWAVPAATDIAFAVGVMALLGRRAPPALRLFLTTIAIVDDMGAVAIIALAYTDHLALPALAGALAVAGGMVLLNRRGVMVLWPYLAGFALLWLLVLASGVHATIAGVVTAMLVPAGKPPGGRTAPLIRLEHALNPWVAFAIVPLFAFANAGVSFAGLSPAVLAQPLVIAIGAGLFIGKQAGIVGGVALAERLGWASRPSGIGWRQLYAAALLAGIGFTMSLFIGGLAFPGDAVRFDEVKIGVLAGSLLSALAGYLVLRFVAAAKGK